MSARGWERVAPIALAMSVAGCGLDLAASDEPATNTCNVDDDCNGAACVSVEGRNVCAATRADLAGVIFQLEGTTTNGIVVSHVFSGGVSIQGESEGGALRSVDLDVPVPRALTGRFLRPGGFLNGCTERDGSVPVKVEARPTDELAGLSQIFTGTSKIDGDSHRFALSVPEGRYDVYLIPQPIQLQGCDALPVAPPALYRDVDVTNDVLLAPEEEEPKRLQGVVIPAPGQDLTGYILELVDAERGLPLSEASPLGAPVDGAIPISGAQPDDEPKGIAYYASPGSDLVLRLRDPVGALVVHWDFGALDLDGDGVVTCELDDLIADAKQLEASVIDAQNRPIAGATVTVKSVSLTGAVSKNASFRVTATSDADGKVHVDLVPGTYQVLVAPPTESGPAILEDVWEVRPDALCCGKSFRVESQSILTARVATGFGEPAASLAVVASPSLPRTRTYFENALESLLVLPRQATGSTDPSGTFAVPVDAGLYDITVQPPPASGFPWLVLPSIVVDRQPASTLEDVVVPFPALFFGRASAQGVDAEGATLRAYLPLAGSETNDTSPIRVVPIGETIVGPEGRFVLAVPPTVARTTPDAAGTTSASSSTGSFQP